MKNLRRIFSIILVLSMLLNMAIGVSAAETGMDPDDTVVDTGFKVSDSGTEECICTIRCSEDNINTECPVCGAENADLNDCQAIENNLAILPQTLSDETEVEYTDPNDWIISNNAYYDEENNYFVLTEDEYWQVGSIWYNIPYEKDFTFEMDYYTGVSERPFNGADGITVAFYAKYVYNKGQGQEMGFYGSEGYGVELDTFHNRDYNDPSNNHIGLVREVGSNHLVTADLPEAEDGGWHHLKIELKDYLCSAYIDGNLKFSYQVENTGYGWIGITSATGSGRNLHAVKNISITGKEPSEYEKLISVSLNKQKLEGPTQENPEQQYKYEITARVHNGMSVTAKNVDIGLHLGEMLTLEDGVSATVNLGDILSNESKTVQWIVYADVPSESMAVDFDVLTLVDNQIRLLTSDYIYLTVRFLYKGIIINHYKNRANLH